ncbi:MAG: ABC transporter permease [Flavobacteriales bacterium]
MNTPLFFAKKLIKSKLADNSSSKSIIKVSVASIAIGIIVLILAMASAKGLQNVIQEKMHVYSAPIQVSHVDYYSKYDYKPLESNKSLDTIFSHLPEVTSFHKAAYQVAMIKNGKDVNPVVLKGYDHNFSWEQFKPYLKEGRFPELNADKKVHEIIISKRLAEKMEYKLQDKVYFFIIDYEKQKEKVKALNIVGIYDVGVVEFDDVFIYGDLKLIQNINGWKNGEFAMWELNTSKKWPLENINSIINDVIPFDLRARTIFELNSNIFVWIEMFDTNIYILLIIIGLVASINLISTILISMLERSEMVGLLKAIGMPNGQLRSVFLYYMIYLVGKGLIIGNIIGLLICGIQKYFKIIPLDQESYHVAYAPISIDFVDVAILNVVFLCISFIVLIIPSIFIKYIQPIKVLQFK